jgi:ABC-2 type transport system permease protein
MSNVTSATMTGKASGAFAPLFKKEVRQLLHKPGALATAILFPVFLMVVVPGLMAFFGSKGMATSPVAGLPLPPGLAALATSSPMIMLREFNMPLFVGMVALFEPSLLAVYAIVSEKERKTIDLLLSLPVTLADIVNAKLAAIIAVSLAAMFPLLLIDFAFLAIQGVGEPIYLLGFIFELLAGITLSTAVALILGLLGKDYRTANNLSGLFLGPMLLVVVGASLVLPFGATRLFILGAFFLALGLAVFYLGMKRFSLERMAL